MVLGRYAVFDSVVSFEHLSMCWLVYGTGMGKVRSVYTVVAMNCLVMGPLARLSGKWRISSR